MSIYDKVYLVFQISGLVICLWLSIYALTRWQFAAGRASAAMLAATCFILSTNVIGWMSNTDLNVELVWIKIGYLGVNTLPVAWFCFALILGGYERWLNRRRVLLMLVLPLLLFGVVLSGGMFAEVRYIPHNGAWAREIDFSGWLYLNVIYTYGLFGTGIVLILRALSRAPYLRRYQSAALILASLMPMVFNIIYLAHILPIPYDLTPLTYAFSGVVLSVGVMRYRVIDLMPVAHSAVADHIRDGILVVDLAGCIADLNPAARQILGMNLPAALGRLLTDLLPALKDCLAEASSHHCEFTQWVNGQPLHLEAAVTLLFIERRLPAGRLIVLHDITARKQIETSLQQALQHERELNEMKERFYAYFAHELRTPLSVILSSSELIEHYGRHWPDDKRRMHFQRIYQAVSHLTELSEQAATFENNGPLQPESQLDLDPTGHITAPLELPA